MSRRHWAGRRAVVALVVAGLTIAVGAGVAAAAPLASIPMPNCCVNGTVAFDGNVYAVAQRDGGSGGEERAALVRVDPATNAVTGELRLMSGHSTGNQINTEPMAVAADSIWVPMYFEDVVLRIDPRTMRITARVTVGRSPDSIAFDGSSLWVALQNDHAVARIDPGTRTVQTVAVGRGGTDSPYQIAFDGTDVLVSLPDSGRVARIDPRTSRVRYDAVGYEAAACARLLAAEGGYWLDDTECSNSYYRWDATARAITAQVSPYPLGDFGAVVVGNALYTAEYRCTDTGCSHGQLVKRDATSGAVLAHRQVAEEAFIVHFAAGSFWVGDWDAASLVRIGYF
jgi:streptogramin lyase